MHPGLKTSLIALALIATFPTDVAARQPPGYPVDSDGDGYLDRNDACPFEPVEHGVAADRLDSRGPMGDEPLTTNKTEAGRRKNRRTEFTILLN